ncbi:RNA polymerase sigma factor [Planctomyces sp. SH-PL62]|uniref:RNA polymerase sigma factor n=1 Tax=Planctomyces sp. SH-PL62 TaxID=1636152 RepID=UPI0008380DB5|nr:sigma-70 family RNA polymerase sigma factor [Planctomyces sp. SH-PL62]
MVWGVCLRILDDPHLAADAFQATFLILVRKAATIRVEASLGRWLYGVSRKVALRVRKSLIRRPIHGDGEFERVAAPEVASERSEMLAALDEEIARLPERYREVLVLCDLGGVAHAEAARRLGCAVGTVGSRLSRGRDRLRRRMLRRGLALSTGVSAAWSPSQAATAAVPSALAASTARAVIRMASPDGPALVGNVSVLARGVLTAMFWHRLRFVAALASLAIIGVGATALSSGIAQELVVAAGRDEPKVLEADTPGRLLAEVQKTYAGAKSYEDEGESTAVFTSPSGKRTVKKPFSTRFLRPNLFYFEFSQRTGDGDGEMDRFVVWSDAAPESSKHWWTLRPKVQEETLQMALGGASGISGGTSTLIPSLLMPEAVPTYPLRVLKDPRFAGEEVVDESSCRKVEGKNLSGDVETYWIDRSTSLVRKLVTKMQFPGATVETTTTFRPRLDVEIPRERFEFKPPKS